MTTRNSLHSFRLLNEGPRCTNPYLISLQAILWYYGHQVEYDYLAGVTGEAFLTAAWDHDCCCQGNLWQHEQLLPLVSRSLGFCSCQIWPESDLHLSCAENVQIMRSRTYANTATSLVTLMAESPAVPGWSASAVATTRSVLEDDTPILVHGGWSGINAHQWGCITGWDENKRAFYGVYPDSNEVHYVAGTPIYACYLVWLDRPVFTAQAIYVESLRQAAAASSPFDLVSGVKSRTLYDLWIDQILSPGYQPTCGKQPWQCHFHLAEYTRYARLAALRYLGMAREYLPANALLALDELEFCYSQVTRTLTRDVSRDYVRGAFDSTTEQYEMAERIALVQRYERQARYALQRLVSMLGSS